MRKKTQQNFLNIDSQYNAKIMNQTTQKFLFQGCASLSLPSSGNRQLQLPSKLAHQMSELSVCLNEAPTSLIYTILARVEVSLHWQGRLLLLGGYNHL